MRITARGGGLTAAAVVLLAAGFGFGYPELAVLGSAAALAVICAVTYALCRPRLDATRIVDPDRVIRGEQATVTLTVRNRDRLRSATLIAEDRCGDRSIPVPLLRLKPGHDTVISYPVPTERRGVVPIGPLHVVRSDPLGLVRVVHSHTGRTMLWVRPRVHALTTIPAGITRDMDGRHDRVPHGSTTFGSLREYVIGDELRRVHWRTSARVGELMIREDLDTSSPRIVVLLDNRAVAHPEAVDGFAETFESACEAAASVVAAAVREELPVTLLSVIEPTDGVHLLDRLAAARLHHADSDEDPMRAAILRLRQRQWGDTLVFLTGPGGAGEFSQVGGLRRRYTTVVVGVFGGQAQIGPEGVLVINAANGRQFAAEWNGVRRW
jgi:uncharacterized protein (DUF58 family)